MSQQDSTTTERSFQHLNEFQRGQLAAFLKVKMPKTQIALELGVSRSTIYEEIKRGTVTQMNSDLTTREQYFPDVGQRVYEENRQRCRKPLKLEQAKDFIDYAQDKILNDKWSPDTVCGRAKKLDLFDVMVCMKTLYNYIGQHLLKVKNIDLAQKVRRKPKKHRPKENIKKLGESIENRPAEIGDRTTFGHWEIDLVIGKREKSEVLLTIDERLSRYRHIIRIDSKSVEAVKQGVDKLKKRYPKVFDELFKSVTSDNGSEFAGLSDEFKQVYYAHPYSSYERGTNERQNGLIRRFIPKGKDISKVPEEMIERAEDFVNELPRKILGYLTPKEIFIKEFSAINQKCPI